MSSRGGKTNVIFSDGTRVAANLVGTDQTTDLAILQVDGDMPGTASFGDSSKLEPGHPVVAIGSALGEFTDTITTGISAACTANWRMRPARCSRT